MYIDKLDISLLTMKKYNNTYHSTIKAKPANVKSITYGHLNRENNKEDPKFEVGDHVRVSKYKIFFSKFNTPNWYEETFVIKSVKNTVPQTYFISDLNEEEIVVTFYKKELPKTFKKSLDLIK